MTPATPSLPETKVLAISSHVVHGYVGNTVATFVLQSLGLEVAALNTVQFSNHLGYGKANGTRLCSQEILDLWLGLKQSGVDEIQILFSGFLPDAISVDAVGQIAQELREKSQKTGSSFFWVLDPIMGDNGRFYVAEIMVPAYKELIKNADLILPNQFEAEILSGVQIIDLSTAKEAITALHTQYQVPHILITSVSFPEPIGSHSLAVIGSTKTSLDEPRPFIIKVPLIDGNFSGTGDMLAALLLVRLREEVHRTPGLYETGQWRSPDAVVETDLPLARAAEKALGSVHEVLLATKEKRDREMMKYYQKLEKRTGSVTEVEAPEVTRAATCKATELRLVRNVSSLISPTICFRAEKLL